MWKSKKFIISAALALTIALASFGGIALAADNGEDTEETAVIDSFWEDIAAALREDGVDVSADQLKDALSTVMESRRSKAMEDYLDQLVEDEVITQDQANAYREWMKAKPDMGEEFGNRGGLFRGRIKMHNFDGMGSRGGMFFFGNPGSNCLPVE